MKTKIQKSEKEKFDVKRIRVLRSTKSEGKFKKHVAKVKEKSSLKIQTLKRFPSILGNKTKSRNKNFISNQKKQKYIDLKNKRNSISNFQKIPNFLNNQQLSNIFRLNKSYFDLKNAKNI